MWFHYGTGMGIGTGKVALLALVWDGVFSILPNTPAKTGVFNIIYDIWVPRSMQSFQLAIPVIK